MTGFGVDMIEEITSQLLAETRQETESLALALESADVRLALDRITDVQRLLEAMRAILRLPRTKGEL